MMRCVICGGEHNFFDPDDDAKLFITDIGRRCVCDDCITDIVVAELMRRWRDSDLSEVEAGE